MNYQNDPLALFTVKCKEGKLKITPQRIAIYQELVNDDSHPTADDIHKKVCKRFPSISFDTVNRTLLLFANIGIIKIAESYGRQKRFDPNIDSHHHLCCIKCNRIIDFHHQAYDELKIPDKIKNNHTVLGKRVVLEIICDKCKKKE